MTLRAMINTDQQVPLLFYRHGLLPIPHDRLPEIQQASRLGQEASGLALGPGTKGESRPESPGHPKVPQK